MYSAGLVLVLLALAGANALPLANMNQDFDFLTVPLAKRDSEQPIFIEQHDLDDLLQLPRTDRKQVQVYPYMDVDLLRLYLDQPRKPVRVEDRPVLSEAPQHD